MSHQHDTSHAHGRSPWPIGFALGIVVLLVGLIVSPWILGGIGAAIALLFAFLWVRDLTVGSALAQAPAVPAESPTGPAIPANVGEAAMPPSEGVTRSKFLTASTLGLGGIIGGLVSGPALGFMVIPAFLRQGYKDVDVGPLSSYPEGKYVVVTFESNPDEGVVSRKTAFVRNNGMATADNGQQQPSFTIISNHCAHLGCPVQPNGPLDQQHASEYNKDVALIPAITIVGFGCPCHGGQYDPEGNRIAGPPVRALDRYSYAIKNGNLFIGKPYSVSQVDGTGANATIHKWRLAFPGEHVSGLESWLYPVQPPH